MCGKNLAFWWFCALLFVASSSKHQLKSTSNEDIDDNLTIRYKLDENFMTNYSDETETLRCDLYETEPSKKEKKITRIHIDEGKAIKDTLNSKITLIILRIASVLLLLGIFLVYSILPELRNAHGFMLRNYSGALSVAYTIEIVNILIKYLSKEDDIQRFVCITIIAFLIVFCFLASFFWLNVMSFDMWWTFRGFCSLQKNVKQGEKKTLVFYTIYAWGFSFIFAIISVIMDWFRNLPKVLRPEFFGGSCSFDEEGAMFVLHYHGCTVTLMSICIISSICLSISTVLKIARYKKDTSHRLTDSESKLYNNNKKWFNLYLKLFIVQFIIMGIKWSMKITLIFSKDELDKLIISSSMRNECNIIEHLHHYVKRDVYTGKDEFLETRGKLSRERFF